MSFSTTSESKGIHRHCNHSAVSYMYWKPGWWGQAQYMRARFFQYTGYGNRHLCDLIFIHFNGRALFSISSLRMLFEFNIFFSMQHFKVSECFRFEVDIESSSECHAVYHNNIILFGILSKERRRIHQTAKVTVKGEDNHQPAKKLQLQQTKTVIRAWGFIVPLYFSVLLLFNLCSIFK